MSKQCVKCGYVRQPSDTAPDYECPKCGVIYDKAVAKVTTKAAAKAGIKQCPYCAEDVKAAATLCPHCKQPIFATHPTTNALVHLIVWASLSVILYVAFMTLAVP